MRIIGLAGKAKSGKNYLAEKILVPEGYIPLSLAGPMKAQLAAEGVIPGEEATGLEEKSQRTRRVLQLFGTELGRDRFYQDVWCVRLEWWLTWFMQHDFDRFAITDVRFPNELEWIQSLGGLVLRVTGRGGLSGEAGDHISETALDSYDLPVINNDPEADLVQLEGDLLGYIERHYEENPEPEPEL